MWPYNSSYSVRITHDIYIPLLYICIYHKNILRQYVVSISINSIDTHTTYRQ
uniref:Histone deacetylase complex subunit SAP30L BINDING n=1 Tax=Myoviridae sp. ctJ2i1 TaxID=2825079 RepID=A0A8S5V1K5_9CAUD|nr:MAG TPA: Histone deacetylase complex subunit SAP30L BINDING [Myoviridae sp. ctJ2i1]